MLSGIEKRARQRTKRRVEILKKGVRRTSAQLPVTNEEHSRMRQCAAKAGLPFGLWLTKAALAEVRRSSLL